MYSEVCIFLEVLLSFFFFWGDLIFASFKQQQVSPKSTFPWWNIYLPHWMIMGMILLTEFIMRMSLTARLMSGKMQMVWIRMLVSGNKMVWRSMFDDACSIEPDWISLSLSLADVRAKSDGFYIFYGFFIVMLLVFWKCVFTKQDLFNFFSYTFLKCVIFICAVTKMYTYYVTIYSVINATALKTNAWFIFRLCLHPCYKVEYWMVLGCLKFTLFSALFVVIYC